MSKSGKLSSEMGGAHLSSRELQKTPDVFSRPRPTPPGVGEFLIGGGGDEQGES
jgi:hypothetical protein